MSKNRKVARVWAFDSNPKHVDSVYVEIWHGKHLKATKWFVDEDAAIDWVRATHGKMIDIEVVVTRVPMANLDQIQEILSKCSPWETL